MRERKEMYDNNIVHYYLWRKYNQTSWIKHILGISYETEKYTQLSRNIARIFVTYIKRSNTEVLVVKLVVFDFKHGT